MVAPRRRVSVTDLCQIGTSKITSSATSTQIHPHRNRTTDATGGGGGGRVRRTFDRKDARMDAPRKEATRNSRSDGRRCVQRAFGSGLAQNKPIPVPPTLTHIDPTNMQTNNSNRARHANLHRKRDRLQRHRLILPLPQLRSHIRDSHSPTAPRPAPYQPPRAPLSCAPRCGAAGRDS